MASHKHRHTTREDFDKPWKIHSLWRNPNKKSHVIGCAVCYPKKAIPVRKVTRIVKLDE